YDDKGSMVCLTDPQGRKQQFSYCAQGDLLARIMPGGATWRWSHDAPGNRERSRNAAFLY
ncbi:hypothetical protein SM957_00015, partial [Escherichia coli]|nr:hypothetical protein [Escherichia coli]